MIYNDKFIWLHFPKNAGTKIENLFKNYFSDCSDIVQDIIDFQDPTIRWHDSVSDRMERNSNFHVENRQIIICVRRLRSWLVSRYNFETKRSPHLAHDYKNLLQGKFFEAGGFLNHADSYVKRYFLDAASISSNIKFIRVENFAEDFKSIFGEYVDVDLIPAEVLRGKENKSMDYIPESFLEEMKEKMSHIYESCPKWRDWEELAYGGLERV